MINGRSNFGVLNTWCPLRQLKNRWFAEHLDICLRTNFSKLKFVKSFHAFAEVLKAQEAVITVLGSLLFFLFPWCFLKIFLEGLDADLSKTFAYLTECASLWCIKYWRLHQLMVIDIAIIVTITFSTSMSSWLLWKLTIDNLEFTLLQSRMHQTWLLLLLYWRSTWILTW